MGRCSGRRRRLFAIAFSAELLIGSVARAAETAATTLGSIDELAAVLAGIGGCEIAFDEEKRTPLLTRPLVSSGVMLRPLLGSGSPGEDAARVLVVIDDRAVRFEGPSGWQRIDVGAQPGLSGMVGAFFDVLHGDTARLDRSYVVRFEPQASPQADWRLVLEPRGADVREMVRRISLEGRGKARRRLVVAEHGDTESVTTFRSVDTTRTFSEEERARLFHLVRRTKTGPATELAVALTSMAFLVIFCAVRFRVVNDLSVFLPVEAGRETAQLARALANTEASRILVFTVEAGGSAEAKEAARSFSEELATHPEIAWVEHGPSPRLAADVEQIYLSRRYNFVSSAPESLAAGAFSQRGLREAAERLKDSLLTPLSPLVSRVAVRDPLLVFPSIAARLPGLRLGELVVEDGSYVTKDGRHAVVLCGTVASGLNADRQGEEVARIEDTIRRIRERYGDRVQLEYTGVGRFAARSQELILGDVTRIGVGSTVAVLLVFLAVLGSTRLLLASVAVVAAGMLSGLASVLWIHGHIHALTLGVGMTLIGVCEDYPVHYFHHWLSGKRRLDPRATMRSLWPALFLGGATSLVGFASLGLTSYAGLREIALFAGTGIGGSLAMTWLLLPPVALHAPKQGRGGTLVARWSRALGKVRLPPLARRPWRRRCCFSLWREQPG
jgi:hypothetical protein